MRLDLSRRTDGELLREFSALVVKDHRGTAEMIAYVGEIQARRLYAPAGYSSMYKYCVHEMHMSEDVAWKRTQVAKLARRFPVILDMIAAGRLHLTALVMLRPYRNAPDFPGLLEAAVHKTKPEIERLLAEHFPRPDVPTEVRPLMTSEPCQKLVPEPVVQTHVSMGSLASDCTGTGHGPASSSVDSAGATSVDPGRPEPSDRPAQETLAAFVDPRAELGPPTRFGPADRVRPLAPQRYAIQVTVGQLAHDLMRRAQEVLGHEVPSGDLELLLIRSFRAVIREVEHAKFAATEKPRRVRPRSTAGKRHIPAMVKRAVNERDGGRCAFVSDSGHRCEERRDLQFDHIEPFARGGEATVNGIRLLCPAHNQYEADRTFGAGFMERKRGPARAGRN